MREEGGEVFCKKCHSVVGRKESKFCNICGSELIESEAACPHSVASGFEIHMTTIWSKFCDVCGKPVQEEMNRIIKGGK